MAGDFGFEPTSAEKDYYFISYRNADQERIAPIVSKLYELGLPIWYDGGINSGELWEKIIPKKIRNCKEVILFLTSHTMRYDEKDTPYVKLEYELAKEDYEKTVHIIQMEEIQNCDVPDHLKLWWKDVRRIQGVNIANVEDFNDQISSVCKAIGVSVDSLLRIKSSSTNSNYASEGLEFKRLNDGNYAVTGIGTCSDRILVIPPKMPDGGKVVQIGDWAFEKCDKFVSAILPSSIREIGAGAFWGCTGFSEITIPYGVECVSDYAFSMCNGLKMIRIPSSVMRMGRDVLRGLKLSAFFDYACTNDIEILCEHPFQPATWDKDWNPDNRPVIWGYIPVHDNEGQPDEGTYDVTDMEVCEEPECRSIKSVSAEYADTLMTDRAAEAFLIESDEQGGIGKMGIISVGIISTFYQPGETVDLASLQKRGIIDGDIGRIKVLASGVLDKPLVIKADAFSVQAIKMIVCAGGQPILLNSGE